MFVEGGEHQLGLICTQREAILGNVYEVLESAADPKVSPLDLRQHFLKKLLVETGFRRGRDKLWFVGDLVNRGPKSRDVLRFVASLGDAAVTVSAYDDVDAFWSDVVEAFRCELAALAQAGCRYVQIDETAFAKFGDPDVRAALAARGDDCDGLIDRYIDVTNRVTRGFPALSIGMHLCRGNRGGRWHAEGSYDAVAERLFNRLEIAFFFLEYDSPRAGDFTPLRFVPKHKSIVLGLVTTKRPAMENTDELRLRICEASRFVDLDRLGVSPQCGFASIATGNPITFEAQEAKLRLVVNLAHLVWGTN